MEKNIEEVLAGIETRLKAAEEMIVKFDEQAEKRMEARAREKELEARILEAKLKWRPKDWFILSGIAAALVGFLAVLALIMVLAFSYVPSNAVVEEVNHKAAVTSTNHSTNSNVANFMVK